MANPLGSKAGKHKLSNFYFSILDTPRHTQSTTNNIILLASLKTEDFKSSGANTISKVIVNELQLLWSDGIDFLIRNQKINVKVCLAQICGDNLGLHGLLDFAEGFTANFPCRYCKMHRNFCQTCVGVANWKMKIKLETPQIIIKIF